MVDSPTLSLVHQEVQKLLDLLDIAPESISVEPAAEENTLTVNLRLPDTDSGVLIGYHAETLSSLQRLLNLIAYQKLGVWYRLLVNINDYRQNREATLTEMAHNTAQRVRLTGQEVVMPYLEAFERRLIHLALANESDIATVSVGEGRNRRLVIRPQSEPH